MNRALRKTLRGWKADFDHVWRKLNTFKRIIAASAIAIASVYGARQWLFDPMREALDAARQKRAGLVLPPGFTTPQEDFDVRQARRAAQDLQQRLIEETASIAALQAEPAIVTRDQQAEVLALLENVLNRHKLHEYSRRTIEDHDVQSTVPVTVYRYHVIGSFPQLHRFLRDLTEFPYPSRFDHFDLRAITTAEQAGTRGRASLELEFRCILFFAD